ncbi:AFL117Cp [Eremothecium gossypii ATCC 10895]|uniref:rRNA methyltransferase 2, mitochondrial n=1 Tax=Eremothecium gossypii (strain ATCC 10895 / CBS 109.51 / FGSC 9923 / NRRL Y-1056) TaxID=284811 RepID=Q755E0_EREGS|nr:AFL117Cp [Eremothecium gossypii ATCC 10895]AAS53257.2 AFL117Cp [Eremothecium gossypii ATCC 10895]AEY97567.1 FAFL117Cp [Eremothecium gossypii FDAG1]
MPVQGLPSVSITPMRELLRGFCRFNSSGRWLSRQRRDPYTREAKVQELRSRAAFKLIEIDEQFRLFRAGQRVLDLGFAPGAWSQVAHQRTQPGGKVMGVDVLPCKPPTGVSSIQANVLSRKTHELVRLYFSRHFQLNMHDELHKKHGYFQHMLEERLEELQKDNSFQPLYGMADPVHEHPLDVVLSDMYEPWPQVTGFWNNFTNAAYSRMANTSGVAVKDHYMSMDLCDAALLCAIALLRPGGSFVCKLYTGKEDQLLERRLRKVFTKVRRFKPEACRSESKELYFVGLDKRKDIDKVAVFTQ